MANEQGTFSTLEAVQVVCLLEDYLDGKQITYRGIPSGCQEIADLALAYSRVAEVLENYDVVRTGYDKAGATI
tara:strand:+ start:56 stop:274 length:219 start_codon:yes stop_codon:yes gene_type:complete